MDVKLSPSKEKAECVILGQAFVIAWNAVCENLTALDKIATRLCRDKEVYGDDLTRLLDGCGLAKPDINYNEEGTWPTI